MQELQSSFQVFQEHLSAMILCLYYRIIIVAFCCFSEHFIVEVESIQHWQHECQKGLVQEGAGGDEEEGTLTNMFSYG